MLQVLVTGLIPGNRNADNIDSKLRQNSHLLYQSRTLQTDGVRAGLLKSFGFGQVGGEVLLVHPEYILATLTKAQFQEYSKRRSIREAQTARYTYDSIIGAGPLVRLKEQPPWDAEAEQRVYLDPTARTVYDPTIRTWRFPHKTEVKAPASNPQSSLTSSISGLLESSTRAHGVDIQLLADLDPTNEAFMKANFSPAERSLILGKPDPQASLAGRWAAKEAVVKALCSLDPTNRPPWRRGGGCTGLIGIEVLDHEGTGVPRVELKDEEIVSWFSDHCTSAASSIKVSISHSGTYAMAAAVIL